MATPAPVSPQPGTGLPPGVEAGPLGPRVLAHLIDSIVPAAVGVLLGLLTPNVSGSQRVVLSIVGLVVIIGWVVIVLRGIATRAASPGMRVMKLQLVGFYDGRPVGWARALLRFVIYTLVNGTGILWIIMIVMLVLHPRKQGWHDLAAKAVMIKERNLAPPRSAQPSVAAQPVQPDQSSPQPPVSQPYDVATPSHPDQDYPPREHDPAPYPPPHDYGQPAYAGQGQPAVAAGAAGASAFVPPPVPGPSSAASPSDPYVDDHPTRAVPVAPAAPTWVAALDDGREITVDGLVLLGRNPQPQPGEEAAQLIKLADETRTVSKSHLVIGLDEAGLFVVDRGSTNGSTVTTPDGISTRCQPGDVRYVEVGSIVSIGDHWLEVRQRG